MKVFEAIQIKNLEIKNRLVVSAMVTNYCTEDGLPTEKFIAYHEHKAKGGWGLIITEDYVISKNTGGFKKLPGLWNDEQINYHRELTDRIHKAGAKIAAQIYHAGRETSSFITGEQPLGPSALKDATMPEIPRELTVEEIHNIVNQFGDCALRAKKAGFDAVEIHGAHGYLIGEFISPYSNKRGDEYGGSIKNRTRFAVEIIKNIKEKCGEDYPVIYRMSVSEYVDGGLEIEESKAIAMILEKAGIDCIHCSQGVYKTTDVIIPSFILPKAAFINNAAEIKSVVNIPVIAAGKINDINIAESVLTSGKTDMVTMARASLADPDMPNKIKAGKEDEVLYCIGCLQGCAGENSCGNSVRCLVNPLTGMEDEYDLTPVPKAKNVLIIGGGVSGCEAAIAAAIKGHKVTLIEKSNKLGGQWLPASVPLGKGEFTTLLYWQKIQLKKYNVQVLLNTEANEELINLYSPDVVIIATGSNPFIPHIKGKDYKFVTTAHEVLEGKIKIGKKVAIIGGGLVGAETADLLAEQGNEVMIIEMQEAIMRDGEKVPANYLRKRLKNNNVRIYTSTKLLEIEDSSIKVETNGKEFTFENLDNVIIAVGVKTDRKILDKITQIKCPVIKVGDANGVKNGYLGIREGFEAGLKI